MANRMIENRRGEGLNLQKNKLRDLPESQPFTLPSHIVQTLEDRDAVVVALDTFIQCMAEQFELPGRTYDNDVKLLSMAVRVRARIG